MIDRQNTTSKINDFLEDENKKILLLRGYDNEAKVNVILNCLNRRFESGILKVSSMQNTPFLINSAFKNKVLPNNIVSTKVYKVGDMSIKISNYLGGTRNNWTGNQDMFTLYHPVQYVLNNSERYPKFLKEVKECQSRKIILSTTNEWSVEDWDIEKHVDQVIFYSVENDNPQLMENLRNNGAI